MKVSVLAPAKINLTLNIEGRRKDGYHLLSSVFQSVSLSDELTVSVEDTCNGIILTTSDPTIPSDERNTAFKAAQWFYRAMDRSPCVRIHIDKHIPHQAGLGGGSADAAGVLVGLNILYGAPFSVQQLCEIGEKVGADVPFCIVGGTAFVEGIGEIITPIEPLAPCEIVIAKPSVGVSTKEAYAAVDSCATVPADQSAMRAAIQRGELSSVGKLLSNAFEQALILPQVDTLLDTMRLCHPLGCAMSGSGSAVFALFDDKDKAASCIAMFPTDIQTAACVPLCHGAIVTSFVN